MRKKICVFPADVCRWFLGGFIYSIRGGVFCNAQTANFICMGMAIGN